MAVRYLYGDSHPFPNGYDFLSELKTLVGAASRALALAHDADAMEQGLGERAQVHLHAIEALQSFFDGMTEVIAERTARSGVPQIVGPYARELLQQVELIGARARSSRANELDQTQVDVTSKIRERRAEIRKVIAQYLLTDPLPVNSWAMSLSLAGDAPSGQIVLAHPDDLTTSFALDVAGDSTWGRPRKVSEMVQGMAIQVGWKKAFLRSSLNPDIATLDDLTIAAVELGPDSMELRLRKKPDSAKDSYVLTVDPKPQGGILAKVTRLDDKKQDSDAPHTSEGDDVSRMNELGAALKRSCEPLLGRKSRLVYAQLDGHDVFERGLVRALFERITARIAHVAAEVSSHSPNETELSLKLEREDGRREELYQRKDELVALVEPLPPESRELFRKLCFLPPDPHPPSAPPPPKHRL